ncbi:hypothetical protein Poli38472_002009 [Pythium oligandrum]|uniref:Uncharacterized protein n=1 Tax=Pythium oligandrum TaxID=41045 RepID=A0A8K1FTR5_PYTOL|nr:hypothetical protein Poli38472_002009 [Pythium oligandrum]|eukprot:TMW69853.1 hypothetical protein Poli38472_002009 [Pythium oligandrum]
MALFPPELIAAVLVAFLQVRLRSIFSLASLFINGLSFFLPPEDELIQRLNGGAAPANNATSTKSKGKSAATHTTPLSSDEKMQQFYIKVAKTETGIFQQTLFFELYEMLVILASSALVACVCGDSLAYWRQWNSDAAEAALDASSTIQASIYGLISVLLVSLWFPLMIKFAQGLETYEARLGIGIGVLGFILALFAIFSPKPLFDFDVEEAVALAGERLEIVFRAIGFVDGDFANLASAAGFARLSVYASLALLAGIFSSTAFLPAFRFARMYAEMVNDKQTGVIQKILLHLNIFLPLLAGICWIKPLSTDIVVPKTLVQCSPRSLTRDCFASAEDEAAFQASWMSLKESQWNTVRIYIVLFTVLVRLLCFRAHLQYFLIEPKDAIVQIVRRPGHVDGELLQNKVRVQFNYLPIIAVQYLAPASAILASALLLAEQTGTSLGVYDAFSTLLILVGAVQAPTKGLAWFSPASNLLPDSTPPQLEGFSLGDDMTRETLTKVIKGMSNYQVVTPRSYASFIGFFLWWLTFTWFAMTVAGFVYWKNVPHVSTTEQELAFAGQRRNRETPKTLKNQLKSLKLKKR